ncbi:hypothetical protein ACEN17_10270 [Corynebacterium rouxii]|uniref:hypothetical protein n=1 Tax=Corynebacterium rouxii TaxID=2719119 RepID=UPI003CF6C874
MSILPKLGRRALTSITATAIIAGGVVAPQALADDIKNADLYWGFSGSSHSKYDHNGPKFEKADKGAELTNIDAASVYAETFKKGVFPDTRREKSGILVFHNGEVKTETNHSNYQINWPGEVTMKLGFGDDELVIKDLNLMLKNGNMGELKATVGEKSNIKLFDVQEYSVSDKTITVTPKIPTCTTGTWKPWHNDLISELGSLKSVFFESYTCNNNDIAKQPLPLTVVLNAEKPAEQANPASNKDNTSGEHSDQEHSVISDQEQVGSPEVAAGDTTFSKAKEFLGTKIGRILTIGLSVLGGLGALWTLWTKFSHLFIR